MFYHQTMTPEKSITFIVPALNEEKNLAATINSIYSITHHNRVGNFEIFIFDDGSTDRTGEIANDLAKKHKKIKAIHNEINKGLGYNYKKGVGLARKNYIMMIPGDNEISPDAIGAIIDSIGKADIIIPYQGNQEDRPFIRRILSHTFTFGLNLLFFLKIKYYNGPVIHKAEIIKKYPVKTSSFAYQAEALIKILKDGYSYYELSMTIQETGRPTTVFKPKRVIALIKAIIQLFWEMQIEKTVLKNNPKLKSLAKQFTKFCFVGLGNAVIDFSIYLTLTRVFNLYFVLANIGAFIVAVTSSFLINKKWTFHDSGGEHTKKYIKFIVTNLIGLGINTTLLYCFVTYLGLFDVLAKIMAIVLTTFWNFSTSKYWTFKK